jgi:hypothetical protein
MDKYSILKNYIKTSPILTQKKTITIKKLSKKKEKKNESKQRREML